eukprot:SAG31_NODE_1720_length_7455_cov_3.242115_2_plen_278_part_00
MGVLSPPPHCLVRRPTAHSLVHLATPYAHIQTLNNMTDLRASNITIQDKGPLGIKVEAVTMESLPLELFASFDGAQVLVRSLPGEANSLPRVTHIVENGQLDDGMIRVGDLIGAITVREAPPSRRRSFIKISDFETFLRLMDERNARNKKRDSQDMFVSLHVFAHVQLDELSHGFRPRTSPLCSASMSDSSPSSSESNYSPSSSSSSQLSKRRCLQRKLHEVTSKRLTDVCNNDTMPAADSIQSDGNAPRDADSDQVGISQHLHHVFSYVAVLGWYG